MSVSILRTGRIGLVFAAVLGILYIRFAMGLFSESEVSRMIPYAMLAVGLLLTLGAWAFEISGTASIARRDSLWGVCGGVLTFTILRLVDFI